MNFFKMDLYELPKRATGFSSKKFNPYIMGLCLTYHVNLKLSTRQIAHALKEVHGIDISHIMVANYALTAASVIKPFVDSYAYKPSKILSADETYIKVKGINHYVWIVMDNSVGLNNELDELKDIDNMPAKWQILISLGQQTILHMQQIYAS